MSKAEITEKLQEIFRDVFDDDTIVLFDEMTSNDVEDWDSLSHINLINDIEHNLVLHLLLMRLSALKTLESLFG